MLRTTDLPIRALRSMLVAADPVFLKPGDVTELPKRWIEFWLIGDVQ
jgi:hypothetical protein